MTNIRKLRCEKKWTQEQLANKSGLSQAYIQELESGRKVNPSTRVVRKLAYALGVPVSALIEGGGAACMFDAVE